MNKRTYTLLFAAVLGFTACKKDYLSLLPPDTQNSPSFYKTAAQFQQAINGAYQPLQPLYNGSFWVMAEMRSDNTSYEYDPNDRSGILKEEMDEFRELDNNDYPATFLGTSYQIIGRCNVILGRLPAARLDSAVANPIAGQASFLRAFNYFNLVRLFGQVPLVLKEVTSAGEAYNIATKAPVADIYTAIIADAQFAIDHLPEKYTADTDKGRVTKGTAETMLAEVYLTQHNFAAAIPLLRNIIASGVYQLNDNYADNFSISKKNGPESIFEIQYMEGPNGLGSDFIDTFIPWDYYDTDVTGFEIANGAQNGWNIPTQDLVNAYEEGDARKDASLIPFTSDEYGIDLPFIRKYQSVGAVQGITANDFPVYRYADVYLMLAEALNEVAYGDADAFKYLNLVRERAGLDDRTATDLADQASFRDAIAHERQVELAFENHRWFDLLRTGKATEVMKAHAEHERDYKSGSWTINSAAYNNIRLLYQYPLNEQLLEHE